MVSDPEVIVERVEGYSDEIAAAIGRLMPFLSEGTPATPIPEGQLRKIIDRPDRVQLIARLDGVVVGSAVLNTIDGNLHSKGWLEDFVADPGIRRRGIGSRLWEEMIRWCQEQGFDAMDFTSGDEREEAHEFYDNRAERRKTVAYRAHIPKAE